MSKTVGQSIWEDPRLREHMAFIGSKGGRTTGPHKARSSEQARAAVAERWKRYRAHKAEMAKNGSANGKR